MAESSDAYPSTTPVVHGLALFMVSDTVRSEQVAALSAYVARQVAPGDPPPLCHIRFDAPVQRAELSRYDEVAS